MHVGKSFAESFSIWAQLESFMSHKKVSTKIHCLTCIRHVHMYPPKSISEEDIYQKKCPPYKFNFDISLCNMHGNIFEAVDKVFYKVSKTRYNSQL